MTKLIDAYPELAKLMSAAKDNMRRDMREAIGSRDEQWARISRMAGVDEDGNILPPEPGTTISRDAPLFWKPLYPALK